jgi:recombination protein RecA
MPDDELMNEADKRRRKLLDISKARVGAKRALWGDDPKLKRATISTDIAVLDDILGGGWRRGRFGLITGEASMGKTLITQWTIKAFQDRGLVCGFIDPEQTYDEEWFTTTGVNTSDLIVIRPESTEQAFDLATEWAENGMDLIAIDSLAALVPKARAETELAEREVIGLHARKIGEGLAQLNNKNWDSFVLCTNQLRSKVGVVYGSPEAIPGGKAQTFYATYGLKVRRGGWIKENDKRVGYKLKVETFKNKIHRPYLECEIPFMFTGMIDTLAGLLELALELNVITGKRGYFKWKDESIHGMKNLRLRFEENADEFEELKLLVEGDGVVEIPDEGEDF